MKYLPGGEEERDARLEGHVPAEDKAAFIGYIVDIPLRIGEPPTQQHTTDSVVTSPLSSHGGQPVGAVAIIHAMTAHRCASALAGVGREIVVAFRGTVTDDEWLLDLDAYTDLDNDDLLGNTIGHSEEYHQIHQVRDHLVINHSHSLLMAWPYAPRRRPIKSGARCTLGSAGTTMATVVLRDPSFRTGRSPG